MKAPNDHLRRVPGESLSLGVWIIVLIAIVSAILIMVRPERRTTGLVMWTRARNHLLMYEPAVARWSNESSGREPVQIYLMSDQALDRRMLSGFLAETHLADLIEIERSSAGRIFSGPLEDVGFVDLTDRLREEGLTAQINEPSFGPWTSRGRIFGLPHDVHPVLLAYRADLVEGAGIDVSQIETWDDFVRLLRPLIEDLDGDGRPDRYLLNFWHTNMDHTELLTLQAGGAYFDDHGRPTLDSDVNAEVVARLATWVCGPSRIAADAPEFSASGNRMRLEGLVVCSFAPDWMCGVWQQDMPGLAGRVKLMSLPTWRKGGTRTSVWGGSMLGIPKTTAHFDDAWALAKYLYTSEKVARQLYRKNGIISPVKRLWSCTFYDEPNPYFSGQTPGRMYIDAAPHVPRRTSSPYNMMAKAYVRDALVELRRYALKHDLYTPDALIGEARRLLTLANDRIRRQMDRNVFLSEAPR